MNANSLNEFCILAQQPNLIGMIADSIIYELPNTDTVFDFAYEDENELEDAIKYYTERGFIINKEMQSSDDGEVTGFLNITWRNQL